MEEYFDYYATRTEFLDKVFRQVYVENNEFEQAVRIAYDETLTHLEPHSLITATKGAEHASRFVTKTEVLDALEKDAQEAWEKHPTEKAVQVNDALKELLETTYDEPGELLVDVEPSEDGSEYVPLLPSQLDISPRQLSRNGVKVSPFEQALAVDVIHSWLEEEYPEYLDTE